MPDPNQTQNTDQNSTQNPPPPDGNQAGNQAGGDTSGDRGFKPVTSQEEFDRMIQERLRRERESVSKETREATEKEVREKIEREAKEKEDREQGNYKALYEQAQKDIEGLKKSIDDLKAERETETLAQIRTRIGEKIGLPVEVSERLQGKDEKEIEEDAKRLAKVVAPKPKAPDTEGGKPNRKPGSGNRSGITHRFGSSTRVVKFPERVTKE